MLPQLMGWCVYHGRRRKETSRTEAVLLYVVGCWSANAAFYVRRWEPEDAREMSRNDLRCNGYVERQV
jgi:hypothetical protein